MATSSNVMNWKRALIPALVVLPLLVLFASRFGTNPHEIPTVLQGKPAPRFALQTLDGKTITSESLRGKPTLINFWATYCVPCKYEHDILQQAARRYGDRVNFLGILYQDTPEAAREYVKKTVNLYPHLIDPDAGLAIELGVTGVPESFFIGADGIIEHKQVGVVTPELVTNTLGRLLEKNAATGRGS